jgi:tRNA (cmo5U34)-methyltransferase
MSGGRIGMTGWDDPGAAAAWDAVSEESPARAEQLALLLAVLRAARPRRVLEAGVGSGRVAERILDALPGAQLVGLDGSAAMLDLARLRLSLFAGRVELVEADLARPGGVEVESFDAVVSVQALHHLEDAEKAACLAWLALLLRPGGLLLLRDKVAIAPRVFADHAAVWRVRETAMPATADAYAAELHAKGDRPAALELHLRWLRDAGLEPTVLDATGHYVLLAARR